MGAVGGSHLQTERETVSEHCGVCICWRAYCSGASHYYPAAAGVLAAGAAVGLLRDAL